MTCPHCGAEVIPGNAFCHRCRKRIGKATESAASRPYREVVDPVARGADAGDVLVEGGAPAGRERKARGGAQTKVYIVGGAVVAVAVTIGAALGLPALHRARQRTNEAAAAAELRELIAAEVAYANANGGFYDSPECLGAPRRCLRDPKAQAKPFLDASRLGGEHHGYALTFVAGSTAPILVLSRGEISPTSLESFTFLMIPAHPASSAQRSLCGDSTGHVCAVPDASPPKTLNGLCAGGCTPVLEPSR